MAAYWLTVSEALFALTDVRGPFRLTEQQARQVIIRLPKRTVGDEVEVYLGIPHILRY